MYLDTSALAKRYLNEDGSEALDRFLMEEGRAWVSTLTAVEMRCLLARRVRSGEIDTAAEARVLAAFEEDLLAGVFTLHSLTDGEFWDAFRLVGEYHGYALRSLDALHLACAVSVGASGLATADRTMARVADALLPSVTLF